MENYYLERSPGADALVIAFAGYGAKVLKNPTFDFYALTGAFHCNRILLKDPSKRLFLGGIGGEIDSFEKLLQKLRSDIEAINPKTLIILGSSGGGFSALLFGHYLKANIVYAFSPTSYTDLYNLIRYRKWSRFRRYKREFFNLYQLPLRLWRFLDLRNVLSKYNGFTAFSIFVCGGALEDVAMAKHLENCPGLKITVQPCNTHNVLRSMIESKELLNLLQQYLSCNPETPGKVRKTAEQLSGVN
jgi:hypothetical protein